MTSKLTLYNDALLAIGQERLASLTEANAARYALDDAYDQTLRYCLEQGFWNFALRAVQIDASASVVPTFGFTAAFDKPSDWIRTLVLSANPELRPPLAASEIVEEPNYWFANCDPLYVKYVSDDTAYGRDLSLWPETFANYVVHRLAVRICKRVTGADPSDEIKRDERRALADARSKDAMNEPSGEMPAGSWVNSRRGGLSNRSRWDGTFR